MSKRALISLAIAIGLLYVIRELIYTGVRRTEAGEFAKLRTVFLEANDFDLLVIGSSRAECQFYMPIIDSATGLRSYNAGMTGATMPFIHSTLQAYLRNSQAPEYVVLNLDLHSLGDNSDTVYNFARYFPFLENEILYEGLNAQDGRFTYFRWLPFYSMPYFNNRYLSNSLHGWTNTPTQFDADYVQGFAPSIPNLRMGDLDTATMIVTHAGIPAPVWEATLAIRDLCSRNDIQLIFVVSPLFHRQEASVPGYAQSLEQFRALAQEHNIGWIDLGRDSIRMQKQLYTDPAHLTREGAQVFTRHFSVALEQYLRK
jgi:hypothetical protein